MYRIWCKFEPDHINPMTARRGQWRVVSCDELMDGGGLVVRSLLDLPWYREKFIGVASSKPYPRGSIIRPHRELNRVLAARRASQS